MTAGPIDTPVVLAQCDKCQQYVFSCQVAGFKIMVDPTPLNGIATYREMLIAGKTLYRLFESKKLRPVQAPRLGESRDLVASHGCTVGRVVRGQAVEVPPVGPQSAPVTPGGLQGGSHPGTAPVSGSQGHTATPYQDLVEAEARGLFNSKLLSPVPPASPRRSDLRVTKPTRCNICRKLITVDTKDVYAIEYDHRMVYAVHDQC